MVGLIPVIRVKKTDGIKPIGGRASRTYTARCISIVGVIGNPDVYHAFPVFNIAGRESIGDHNVSDITLLHKDAFVTPS